MIPKFFVKTQRWEPIENLSLEERSNPDLVTKPHPHDYSTSLYLAQDNPETGNLLIGKGRLYLGYLMTSLASGGFMYVAMGSSTVAIDTLNDDRLGGYSGSSTPAFEYNLNASRPILQSTASGGNATKADWTQNTYTSPSSDIYQYEYQVQVTYGPGDANGTSAGVPLQRYGINTVPALPTTVSGLSGVMLNELIDVEAQTLTTSNQVIVKFILRI